MFRKANTRQYYRHQAQDHIMRLLSGCVVPDEDNLSDEVQEALLHEFRRIEKFFGYQAKSWENHFANQQRTDADA